jgi:hypothetical protein
MCTAEPNLNSVRGKTLALAGVGNNAYPSSAKLNEGEARSKARDTTCAKLRNMINVKRPRPAGVQGFKSPPPHHFSIYRYGTVKHLQCVLLGKRRQSMGRVRLLTTGGDG